MMCALSTLSQDRFHCIHLCPPFRPSVLGVVYLAFIYWSCGSRGDEEKVLLLGVEEGEEEGKEGEGSCFNRRWVKELSVR